MMIWNVPHVYFVDSYRSRFSRHCQLHEYCDRACVRYNYRYVRSYSLSERALSLLCVCGWREEYKRASLSLSHFVGGSSLSVHMPIVPSVWRRSLRLLGLLRSFNANSA